MKNLEESYDFFTKSKLLSIYHHVLGFFFLFYVSETGKWPHNLTYIYSTFNSLRGHVYLVAIIFITDLLVTCI